MCPLLYQIFFFQKLQDLDDDLKEKYLELITRFYLLFENLYQYIVDLNTFIEQLNDGGFIQQNIETVMKDMEGKQLLVIISHWRLFYAHDIHL